ncbi:MAG: DUF3822 family protein [Chitinophagaceae bacterium]|nr:DUF3822 family protein [Chitinophagaceae bacterium]
MSAVYQIQVPAGIPEDTSGCHLYIHIGPDHLTFAVLNTVDSGFLALQHFNLEKYNALAHCTEIITHNEWLNRFYAHITVVYNFGDSILVPEKFYMPAINEPSLDLVYGDLNKGRQFADHVPAWELYLIYRVPEALHHIFESHFPSAEFMHSYSSFLKIKKQRSGETGSELNAIFYNNKLIISLFKDAGLLLMRSFEYETSEDVAYHLLNICRQFDVDCEKVTLVISGLIADHSAVYAELQKYFLFLQLDQRPADFKYSEAFDEYPPHFFTYIFNAALCG